jgi:hypothetical protein
MVLGNLAARQYRLDTILYALGTRLSVIHIPMVGSLAPFTACDRIIENLKRIPVLRPRNG